MSVTCKLINKNEYLYFESSERGEKFSICLGRTNERKTWVKARAVAKAYHQEKMQEHEHKILAFDKIADFIGAEKDHVHTHAHTFRIAEDHEHGVSSDLTSRDSHIHPFKSMSLKDRLREIVEQIDKEYEPKEREEIDYKRLKEIMSRLSRQKR